jgi:hypothetical protein
MPWIEIIRLIAPIIVDIIKNKNVAAPAAVECWNSNDGRVNMVRDICKNARAQNLPVSDADIILALAQAAEDPLLPLYIEAITA